VHRTVPRHPRHLDRRHRLPALQRALGFDAAGLQWIFNAYVVAFGGLLLLGGRLADLFGPRRLFAIGFGVLTASSLVAGLARRPRAAHRARCAGRRRGADRAGRAVDGHGVCSRPGPPSCASALGFWGASAAAGGTAGVFLGGVITEWLSWRWTFLVNVPVGALVLAGHDGVACRAALASAAASTWPAR
jgi:MFS family permease